MKKALLDQWIMDVDGAACQVQRRMAEPLEEIASVKGNKWVITDFGGAVPRFMTIDAPVKYAEIMLQRRLQDQGEIGENARICTHWKRARGDRSTDIFFTAVEGDLLGAFEDRAREDVDHHLFFSVYAVMYACLRDFSKNRMTLLMFEHDRHVDLLLGRSGQVLAASRVSGYSNAREVKEQQVETVGHELQAMLAELHGKLELIVHSGWMRGVETEAASTTGFSSSGRSTGFSAFSQFETREAATQTGWASSESASLGKEQSRLMTVEWGQKLARNFNVPIKLLKPKLYEIKGDEFVVSSFQEAMSHLDVGDAISPAIDRYQYLAQRLMPWMTILSLLIVSGLYLGGLWMQRQTALVNEEIQKLTDIGSAAALKVEPVDPEFPRMVEFTDGLNRLKTASSFQGVLVDISNSMNGKVVFDQLIVEYNDRIKAVMTLKGRIKSPFAQASQEHENFVGALISRGYRVIKSDLSTDVAELLFTLKLERE
ncbi:MAG: hypothetical protein HQM00_08025 [Magnetococcales bacterium]|nr:hypothetical protein [Magnetococcales bacterium]